MIISVRVGKEIANHRRKIAFSQFFLDSLEIVVKSSELSLESQRNKLLHSWGMVTPINNCWSSSEKGSNLHRL